MNHWFYEPRFRHDVVEVPIIWLTIALSILVHVAALILLMMHLLQTKDQEQDEASDRLQVRLAPQAKLAPAESARAQEVEPPRPVVTPPKQTVRARPPPLVARPNREAPVVPLPPPMVPPQPPATPAVATPPPTAPPIAGDLWAYVQAKRRARGEPEAPPIDDERTQFDRRVASNLAAPAHGVGVQTRNGGGIFEIKRMAYDDAAFEFYGWNTEMGRRTPQLIEVRKGDNSDMRIAVVRRMIAIIRQYEKADFVWENPRKDRKYTLSARLSDNAELETFLMNEFFGDPSNLH